MQQILQVSSKTYLTWIYSIFFFQLAIQDGSPCSILRIPHGVLIYIAYLSRCFRFLSQAATSISDKTHFMFREVPFSPFPPEDKNESSCVNQRQLCY